MSWGQSFGTAWGSAWGDADTPGPVPEGNSAWGTSWNGYWGDSWGISGGVVVPPDPTYTPANVTVKAFRPFYFKGFLRGINAQFVITSPYEFTPYGMVLVTAPPSDWLPLLQVYSETNDNDRIRIPGRDETRFPAKKSRVTPQEPGNPYD